VLYGLVTSALRNGNALTIPDRPVYRYFTAKGNCSKGGYCLHLIEFAEKYLCKRVNLMMSAGRQQFSAKRCFIYEA
jgi:hypothetical protein